MTYSLRPTLHGNESIITYNSEDIGSVALINGHWFSTLFRPGAMDVELKGFHNGKQDAINEILALTPHADYPHEMNGDLHDCPPCEAIMRREGTFA